MKAILLGAGQGSRLRPLTADRPKCMVEVRGVPLLHWQLHALRAAGIDDFTVVRGWCRTAIRGAGLRTIDNARWNRTNMVESLRCAIDELHGDVLVAYTDLLYRPHLVQAARDGTADIGVLVDLDWRSLWEQRMADPLSDAETLRFDENGHLLEIGQRPRSYDEIQAQYIGMIRLSPAGSDVMRDALARALAAQRRGETFFGSSRTLDTAYMTDLLMGLVREGVPVKTIPVRGGWTEIDSLDDLRVAEDLVARERWTVPDGPHAELERA